MFEKPQILLVPQEGIEPPTHALRMRCSTPELLRLYCSFSARPARNWTHDSEPYQPIERLNSPGKIVGAVAGVPLGNGAFLPYTMAELRRNLPGRGLPFRRIHRTAVWRNE
jgi:hypothetical protein